MASPMRFAEISPDQIERNLENPRTEFDEQKLDELAASIQRKGVLVPVTVFEKEKGHYVLLDGQRRWLASKRINRPKIPAWISPKPDPVENLEAMFHIHMEREEWSNADGVQALAKLINASGVSGPAQLEEMTGISQLRIVEWQRILKQPMEYQSLIYEGKLPFNFFTELHERVIQPLKEERPSVFRKIGNERKITEFFVERRQAGHLENVTGLLRQVNTIIHKAKDAAGPKDSPHDRTIERLITDIKYPIEDAYEDVIGAAVETAKFIKQCQRLAQRLKILIKEELSSKEKRGLLKTLRDLSSEIRRALATLKS